MLISRPRTQEAALLEICGGVTVGFKEQPLNRIGEGYFQIGFECDSYSQMSPFISPYPLKLGVYWDN